MTDLITRLKEQLNRIYDRNPYVGLLQIKIADIREGGAELTMPVKSDVHLSLFQKAHGGAVASLADTAMGVACATMGKRVVTLDMNINFIYGATAGETLTSCARVIHSGKNTIVVEADITDTAGRLLAKARGTFFVIGLFAFEQG